VLVDRAQMTQLLLNLAQNGLAATEKSGRPGRVDLIAEQNGATTVLEVRDNGVGIAAEERERIFDLFYSARKGGTGLGLAIVSRIAQSHGGNVEVASEPGHGTTFRLVLPKSAGVPSHGGPALESRQRAARSKASAAPLVP
jgi:signal transduction histidine kinase